MNRLKNSTMSILSVIRKRFTTPLPDHYSTIEELPIYNWWKVHETGNFEYLLYTRKTSSKKEVKKLARVWKSLYEQYIQRFGYTEQFIETMSKKREIALLKVDYITSGDKSLKVFIQIAEKELEEMTGEETDFYQGKSMLEKSLGFYIDIHRMSVAEYYSHFQVAKKTTKTTKPTE